jgi:osmotically inducible protein OsmC
LVGLFD